MEDVQAVSPAMDVSNPPTLTCCAMEPIGNGQNKVLMIFSDQSGPTHVTYREGECECIWGPNGIAFQSTGSVSVHLTLPADPLWTTCNLPAGVVSANTFNMPFNGSWITSGNPTGGPISGTFGQFTQYVASEKEQSKDPQNFTPIGIMNWPQSWGIAVEALANTDRIKVTLSTNDQATQLRRIGVLPIDGGTAAAYAHANGGREYTLDLAAIQDGFYQVVLDFNPGFHLITSVEKTTPRR